MRDQVITILTKPISENEYAPAQRRRHDAELAAAEKRPFHGPFESADEAIAYVKKELKSAKP